MVKNGKKKKDEMEKAAEAFEKKMTNSIDVLKSIVNEMPMRKEINKIERDAKTQYVRLLFNEYGIFSKKMLDELIKSGFEFAYVSGNLNGFEVVLRVI